MNRAEEGSTVHPVRPPAGIDYLSVLNLYDNSFWWSDVVMVVVSGINSSNMLEVDADEDPDKKLQEAKDGMSAHGKGSLPFVACVADRRHFWLND